MFRGDQKLKLKKRETKTPGLANNKKARIFIEPNNQIKNKNRPHSKYILGNKGKNNKNKLPIQINNNMNNIKVNNLNINMKKNNINNINIINNINNIKNIDHNKIQKFNGPVNIHNINLIKKKIILEPKVKNNNHRQLSNEPQGIKLNFNNNKIIKNNLINNNDINNNNIFNQLSKSLKKNNFQQNNEIKFYNLIEDNNKQNQKKIILQNNNNIKKIFIKEKKEDTNENLPILKNDNNKIFFKQENLKPNNNMAMPMPIPNQLNLLKIKKDDKKKNIHINPLNKNKFNGFINNNFKNNKKKIFVNLPDNNQNNRINNLININININNNNNFNNFDNNNNNRYFFNNQFMDNNNYKQNKKNNNNRQNNFINNRHNIHSNNHVNNNKFRIDKSIEDLIKKNNIKNNSKEKNNVISRQIVSSSEEPIIKNENILRGANINKHENKENKVYNLKVIKPDNNNNENTSRILDYCFEENINSNFNETMEDYTLIKHPFFSKGKNILSVFAIFDGHGGSDVAKYLKNNFLDNLGKIIETNITSGLTEILKNTIAFSEKNIEKLENSKKCGSTGTIVLVNNYNVYCANVGDSKCYYINDKEAIQLTEVHNCSNEKEVQLLKNKGVMIFNKKVYGSLSLTRSFGDMEFKVEGITAIPHIKKIFANQENVRYIVLASDGIWDVVDEKILFKLSTELKKKTCEEFCNNLVKYALENGSRDNISCIILKFAD